MTLPPPVPPAFRSPAWARAAILGGVVGPAAFIASWGVLGATRADYEPTRRYISDLAAIGASTRPWMTGGLVAFGLGLSLYGVAARAYGHRSIGAFGVLTGVSSLGVAAFPLGTSSAHGHVAAAAVGYATLVAIPITGAVLHARSRRYGWAAVSAALAVASTTALVVSTKGAGSYPGLFQRAGLTLSDVWVASHAIALWRTHSASKSGPGASAVIR